MHSSAWQDLAIEESFCHGKIHGAMELWRGLRQLNLLRASALLPSVTHQGGIRFKPELRVRNQDYRGMKVDHFVVEKR